jgi:hypothetical protein
MGAKGDLIERESDQAMDLPVTSVFLLDNSNKQLIQYHHHHQTTTVHCWT